MTATPAECRRFADDIALVTGSTRGIGAGVARRLVAEGATVVVTGRSVEAGEAVAAELSDLAATEGTGGDARFVPADLRDPDDVAALVAATVEEFGRIDVLVNNAGVQTETTAADATVDDWSFVVETDFRSFWLCVKHAVEHVPPGGAVVNTSSNHARSTMPGLFPYNAVKAGIDGMTRAMALELGPLGIRVNTVNPGWVAVERTAAELAADDRAHVEAIHPVGRIGTPADVAGAVAFLASDDAAFVTGASPLVDGGDGRPHVPGVRRVRPGRRRRLRRSPSPTCSNSSVGRRPAVVGDRVGPFRDRPPTATGRVADDCRLDGVRRSSPSDGPDARPVRTASDRTERTFGRRGRLDDPSSRRADAAVGLDRSTARV